MFARMNSAEDLKPWAIIIIIAPVIPQVVIDMQPAISSPICLTDE